MPVPIGLQARLRSNGRAACRQGVIEAKRITPDVKHCGNAGAVHAVQCAAH
jgi:hypothetical protein